MAEISDHYRTLTAGFARRIAGVTAEDWENQSPCPEWTAREVLDHVVDTQKRFLGLVDIEAPVGPSVDDDPAGSFAVFSGALQSALDDRSTAEKTFEGFAGESTLEAAVLRFVCTDLVIHGWDIAHATGGDESIDAAEMDRIRGVCADFGDALRSPGAFGPEVSVGAAADEQTRFLAFLGRKT